MVPGSFSLFILVHHTRPTKICANYMVPGSFSLFILVHHTRPTKIHANYIQSLTLVLGITTSLTFFISRVIEIIGIE